jgi:hypothetical protein
MESLSETEPKGTRNLFRNLHKNLSINLNNETANEAQCDASGSFCDWPSLVPMAELRNTSLVSVNDGSTHHAAVWTLPLGALSRPQPRERAWPPGLSTLALPGPELLNRPLGAACGGWPSIEPV